jgi:hypothetical protein
MYVKITFIVAVVFLSFTVLLLKGFVPALYSSFPGPSKCYGFVIDRNDIEGYPDPRCIGFFKMYHE